MVRESWRSVASNAVYSLSVWCEATKWAGRRAGLVWVLLRRNGVEEIGFRPGYEDMMKIGLPALRLSSAGTGEELIRAPPSGSVEQDAPP